MHILRRSWEDIRQGENIDLYVTVIVAILLAILNLIGFAPQNWLAPINLAVLALIAFAVLGNRHRLERIIENVTHTSQGLFLTEYPESFKIDLIDASELWLVGMNLQRTITTYYPVLEKNLKEGDAVKILLLDPDGIAKAQAAHRYYRPADEEGFRRSIIGTMRDLCELKQVAPDRLEIRVLDYPFAFGAMAADPNMAKGVIYLEHYAFKMPGDIPKMVMKPEDGYWYDFFKSQISAWWQSSSKWECRRKPTSLQESQTTESSQTSNLGPIIHG